MKNERPMLISVLCIFGFISVPISIAFISLLLVSEVTALAEVSIPIAYPIIGIILALAYLVGYISIWKMKKWGLVLITLVAIIDYIVPFMFGLGNVLGFIFPAIFIGLFWTQHKKMS